MWTEEVVLARFIEACDVERRMVVKGGPSSGNAWPTYYYDKDDMAGWDDQAIQDNLERWQGRKVTKSPELTRWEECFYHWTPMIPEARRVLIWRFAQCQSNGGSFSEWCRNKGIVRQTAYNRITRILETLAEQFAKEARRLLEPDAKFYRQSGDVRYVGDNSMNTCVATNYTPKAWRSEDAVLADHPELRDFSWADNRVSRRAAKLLNSKKVEPESITP